MNRLDVSVLIGSRNRPHVLRRCIHSVLDQDSENVVEIIILDDGSDLEHAAEYASFASVDPRIRCLRNDDPRGVAGGRNQLMAVAGGAILFFLDDDAVLANSACVAAVSQSFQSDPALGIIAGKVINHLDNRTALLVPFSRHSLMRDPSLTENAQLVSYFIGCCHAIRRDVINVCGGYSPGLVFGEEELDLAYRAVNAGFRIAYLPTVVAHHYPQPSVVKRARGMHNAELFHHTRNRFLLAYKYLPVRYAVVYLAIWLVVYARDAITQLAVRDYLRGILYGIRSLPAQTRQPLSADAVSYLRANHGRLWY